ncbi:hypothetical protein Tco_1346786, partial [Tanacetum coccineum]
MGCMMLTGSMGINGCMTTKGADGWWNHGPDVTAACKTMEVNVGLIYVVDGAWFSVNVMDVPLSRVADINDNTMHVNSTKVV